MSAADLSIVIHAPGLPIPALDPATVPLGGSETAAVCLAAALARLGHTVSLVCETPSRRRWDGVDYIPAGGPWQSGEAVDLFLSSRYHQVLGTAVNAEMVGLWYHDVAGPASLPPARALSRASFHCFGSSYHRDGFLRLLPGIEPYATVIHNGVDFARVGQARSAAQERQPLRFLYASRAERGLLVLLRDLWPRLVDRWPAAELRIASYCPAPGPLSAHLDALIARARNVRPLGALDKGRLWQEIASCRALLYPTNFPETSCLIALESQALGTPVVTSDRFALCETVAAAATRIGEQWGSEAYLARFIAAVERLVEDEPHFGAVQSEGMAHIRAETHSWEAVAGAWVAHVRELFGQRAARSRAGILRRLLCDGRQAEARQWVADHPQPTPGYDARSLRLLAAPPSGVETATTAGRRGPAERLRPLPRLAAALLVRNEEAWIRRAIHSLESLADEIVVGDTGSDDRTQDILRDLGFVAAPAPDRDQPRRLVAIQFEDFAQARTDLAAAVTEADYLLSIDPDEVLMDGAVLRRWIDENAYADLLCIEQRNLLADGPPGSVLPGRVWRRQTPGAPLRWVGCVHELLEHGVNQIPLRAVEISGSYLLHAGYVFPEASHKGRRNLALLLRDRTRNPERQIALFYGLRECLRLAEDEIRAAGRPTRKAYEHLNRGWEIWAHHAPRVMPGVRHLMHPVSRALLAVLARHSLKLRSTGQVPFEVEMGFAARRGVPLGPGDSPPRFRQHYATVDELRHEILERLTQTERDLPAPLTDDLPADAPESTVATAGYEVPPDLFGLE